MIVAGAKRNNPRRRNRDPVGQDDPARQIEWICLIALSRLPSDEERDLGLVAIAKLTEEWAQHAAHAGKPSQNESAQRGLATFCHSIMNSAEFLYVD